MTEPRTSRRAVIGWGAAAVVGLAAAGTALRGFVLPRRYPATPYDDLLNQLDDRAAAARVGRALAGRGRIDARADATSLRQQLSGTSLQAAIADDLSKGRLTEAAGWVLPETFARLCSLAAATLP